MHSRAGLAERLPERSRCQQDGSSGVSVFPVCPRFLQPESLGVWNMASSLRSGLNNLLTTGNFLFFIHIRRFELLACYFKDYCGNLMSSFWSEMFWTFALCSRRAGGMRASSFFFLTHPGTVFWFIWKNGGCLAICVSCDFPSKSWLPQLPLENYGIWNLWSSRVGWETHSSGEVFNKPVTPCSG